MQKIIIVCGPTCSGKTTTGIMLAEHFNGEIVSADSQQVYIGLDIGTAKPSKEELKKVPHHLIDILEPDRPFDVAKYVELADDAIEKICMRGRLPIVVGGTGLYIKALCHGIAEGPGRDESYRAELNRIKEEKGVERLYEMLLKVDPVVALRTRKNDVTRIVRALEVFHSTGRSISELQKAHGFGEKRYDFLKIGLRIERNELYKRIEARIDRMMKEGLLNEIESLLHRYGPNVQAFKAVGYKEAVPKLAGSCASDLAGSEISKIVELIKRNTRRYAKRQLTWFRADRDIAWFDPSEHDRIKKVVVKFLKRC